MKHTQLIFRYQKNPRGKAKRYKTKEVIITTAGQIRHYKKSLKHLKRPTSKVKGVVYSNTIHKTGFKQLNKVKKVQKYTNPNYLLNTQIRKLFRELFPSREIQIKTGITFKKFSQQVKQTVFKDQFLKSQKEGVAKTITKLQRRRTYLKNKIAKLSREASEYAWFELKSGRIKSFSLVYKQKSKSELATMTANERLAYEINLTKAVESQASILLGEIGLAVSAMETVFEEKYQKAVETGEFTGEIEEYSPNETA